MTTRRSSARSSPHFASGARRTHPSSLVVAYQGEPGAFSQDAAETLLPAAATVGFGTFDAVAAAVSRGATGAAVLPVENSITGAIPRAYDLLWLHEDLTIETELVYRVVQNLIGTPHATLGAVREVRSHPVALEQCRAFIVRRPEWRSVIAHDTAGAVREIVAANDPAVAAIASRAAAQRYGGVLLAEAIQDDDDNFTRFFLLRPAARPLATPFAVQRRACIALELENKVGALRDALAAFAGAGLNLRSLVSRPSRSGPFAYRFYCEIDGVERAALDAALATAGGATRVLGCY